MTMTMTMTTTEAQLASTFTRRCCNLATFHVSSHPVVHVYMPLSLYLLSLSRCVFVSSAGPGPKAARVLTNFIAVVFFSVVVSFRSVSATFLQLVSFACQLPSALPFCFSSSMASWQCVFVCVCV